MAKKKARKPATPLPAPPAQGEPAAVWMKISELKPWAKNPRQNSKAVGPVALSIQRFGFGNPILARLANREVIGGHTRLLAAEKLGMETVPVRLLDISEEDAHLLALADNKLGEISAWDDAALTALLAEMDPGELDLIGFTEKDLAKLLDESGGTPPSYAPIFHVLVECRDEAHQAEVLEKLTALEIPCKALLA
jgi:hypothetical protein